MKKRHDHRAPATCALRGTFLFIALIAMLLGSASVVNGQSAKSKAPQVKQLTDAEAILRRNWQIAKTNMPDVVSLESQISIKRAKYAKAEAESLQKQALFRAQNQAAGKTGRALSYGAFHDLSPEQARQVEAVTAPVKRLPGEIKALEGQVEVLRLKYFQANHQAAQAAIDARKPAGSPSQ